MLKPVMQFQCFRKDNADKFPLTLTLINTDLGDKWSQDGPNASHATAGTEPHRSHRCWQHLHITVSLNKYN